MELCVTNNSDVASKHGPSIIVAAFQLSMLLSGARSGDALQYCNQAVQVAMV